MSNPQAQPDVRPLGTIALGAAGLTGLLAVSYLLSPLAFVSGVLAVFFAGAARGVPETRTVGTVAIVVAAVGMMVAVVVLAVFG